MERISDTDSIRAAQPPPHRQYRCNSETLLRALIQRALCVAALFWLVVCNGTVPFRTHWIDTTRPLNAAEIGVPLSDPKFPVSVHAHRASKSRRGNFTIYALSGGVRIYQGSFVATAENANIWIDESPTEEQVPRKVIVETNGSSEVKWSEQQSLRDDRWMGRLFSFFEVDVQSDVWFDNPNPPALNWNNEAELANASRGDTNLGVKPAIQWTPTDSANHVRLATQLQSQVPNTLNSTPPGFQTPPRNGYELPPPTSGSGLEIGNSQLGGTVIDPGSVQLFETIRGTPTPAGNSGIAPNENTDVRAFQLPAPGPVIVDNGPVPVPAPVAAMSPTPRPGGQRIGARTFQFSGRGGIEPQFQTVNRPDRGDSVVTISRGIRLMFGDVAVQSGDGVLDMGTVLIEADRAVIWTSDLSKLLSQKIDDLPVELYLEGNIVFQQGQRTIYADRMYYNVQSEYGMILAAEILTPAPQYEGIVRLKADVIQQRSRENFLAYQAAMTSSRLGVPRYWLQADRIEMDDKRNETTTNLFGLPVKGQMGDQTGLRAKARHNFVYIEGLPVAYWPVLNTNVDTSSFYLSGFKVRNDSIFGTQVMVDWDLYQLLGIQAVDGTRWSLSTDYFSKRGAALGTNFKYNVPSFLAGGPANGYLDAWAIQDRGLDILGSDRSSLVPEEETRGRLLLQHRHLLSPDSELWAEVGLVSDRNFLEQYFEQEWDTQKDRSTALRYRNYFDSQMLDIWGQTRLNPFFTETEWLPRLDHYWLGQSLGDVFTWSAHTNVGYARQRVASTPTAPADAAKFQVQPWEVNADGIRAATRQELSLPFDTGYYKFVPFISGEAATWGSDVAGNDISRLTGQAGLRSSLPMWRSFPEVQSSLLNLNGLAHKVSFESEFWYADTTRDLAQFPLYDPIDDNSQEHFRRRLVFNTFGGVLPDKFESTEFAARQGMQRYVSASSTEVVTNQLQSRFGVHQRWQTKRGVAGRERIADVVELDVDAIFFGKPERDNFGENVGAINYDFRYHIGDRVTLISDGYYDMFKDGLRATTLGSVLSRPGRGDLYFGVTTLEGPISSLLLTTTFNYRLNEKWAAVGGSTIDLGSTGNIGQSLGVTRIGESFLVRLGVVVDNGRDNVSFQFNLEPRFFQSRGLGVVGGQLIPPAGKYGLE